MRLFVKDVDNGYVHEYGSDPHDSLILDGGALYYYNLQNGEGTKYGGYKWVDENGNDIEEDDGEKYYHIGFTSDEFKEEYERKKEEVFKMIFKEEVK